MSIIIRAADRLTIPSQSSAAGITSDPDCVYLTSAPMNVYPLPPCPLYCHYDVIKLIARTHDLEFTL